MRILAIDTSCDDTCAAVLEDTKIITNVISPQTNLYKEWGGVVPNIAKLAHKERIDLVIKKAVNPSVSQRLTSPFDKGELLNLIE